VIIALSVVYLTIGYFLTLWFVTKNAQWTIEDKRYSVDIATGGFFQKRLRKKGVIT
jgi:hypothetical protein